MGAWKARVQIRPWHEGGYSAELPCLQGCWIVAPTAEEAIRDIYEVIEMSIASRIKRGEPLPSGLAAVAAEEDGLIEVDVAVAVS